MIQLDYDDVIVLLEKAVGEKGESYVYPRAQYGGCVNFRYDEPACIVGHVLSYLGFGPVVDGPNGFRRSIRAGAVRNVIDETGLVTTYYAERALIRAQEVQDSGLSWGEALEAARREGDHGDR